jgi:hypothetical protein
MALADHLVVSGADGRLVGRSPQDLAQLLDGALSHRRVVVHVHGGLVDEAAGTRVAASLLPVYSQAGAHPLFFVWQAGIREILRNNILEIAREELFERLLRRVLGWAVGRVRSEEEGVRGAGAVLPSETELRSELGRRQRLTDPDAGAEPFADQPLPDANLPPDGTAFVLPAEEEAEFLRQVAGDVELEQQVAGAAADRELEWGNTDGTRGAPAVERVPSRIDQDVLAEIAAGEEEGARGLVSTAVLARKALQVLRSVLLRYRTQTDSGIYPTVVEEVLRAFYLGNVGGAIWHALKKETDDTFSPDHADRAGRMLLTRLAVRRPDDGPRMTLVGHSTGAVFIDNLLSAAARGRPTEAGARSGSRSAAFQVCFLAPACTTQHFGQTLDVADDLIGRFRMFTMTDAAERADRLVGAVYPRSLLYLVSGLLERDRGSSAVAPVLGLSRYLRADGLDRLLASDEAVTARLARVRRYTAEEDRLVLSPTAADALVGARSSARTHGGFDEDALVRASLVQLIESW